MVETGFYASLLQDPDRGFLSDLEMSFLVGNLYIINLTQNLMKQRIAVL